MEAQRRISKVPERSFVPSFRNHSQYPIGTPSNICPSAQTGPSLWYSVQGSGLGLFGSKFAILMRKSESSQRAVVLGGIGRVLTPKALCVSRTATFPKCAQIQSASHN
jgi:hypothetical protein